MTLYYIQAAILTAGTCLSVLSAIFAAMNFVDIFTADDDTEKDKATSATAKSLGYVIVWAGVAVILAGVAKGIHDLFYFWCGQLI